MSNRFCLELLLSGIGENSSSSQCCLEVGEFEVYRETHIFCYRVLTQRFGGSMCTRNTWKDGV